MNNAEILIIDDEIQIRRLLRITLESNDFIVREAESAKQGLVMAANHPPALILLDLGLPDKNGQMVLKELREWYKKPILILSVQSDELGIVTALDNGANDYLIKPFRTGELLARIRSAIRSSQNELNIPVLEYGELKIDLSARSVKKNDVIIKLTSTEYELLATLVKNEGKVLTHQLLLKQTWGPSFINESQYLRVYIGQLRKKLEDNPNKPKFILTESGVGYRFINPE